VPESRFKPGDRVRISSPSILLSSDFTGCFLNVGESPVTGVVLAEIVLMRVRMDRPVMPGTQEVWIVPESDLVPDPPVSAQGS